MIQLKISDFSCIRSAEIELGAVNVLIGPQASGKSVISKLLYFFVDLLSEQYRAVAAEKSFDAFVDELKVRFGEWFPLSAWGNKKFKIEFKAGQYSIRLTRSSYNESLNDTLRIWTSPLVKSHYKESLEIFRATKAKADKRRDARFALFELAYSVSTEAGKRLRSVLKADYIDDQTFIPAGRSFFTSLGKAFLAFDQGRVLDPITVRFGRLYSSMQDGFHFEMNRHRQSDFEQDLQTILGGEIVWEGERATVQCPDGRKIPFSALSSGQQELLPLVVAIGAFSQYFQRGERSSHLVYIEEPEAHLFPSAQSRLIQGLAGFAQTGTRSRRLLLTTHSPYVLSKINNLIKAGQLESSLPEARQGELSRIVPKRNRIAPGITRAHALVDGELKSIIDEDGLIAADYLDDISGDIGAEFSKLLELELSA